MPAHVAYQAEDLARCIGKRSLGRRYSKLRIRFVELHQQIAAPDLIGVVHLHGNHGTDNLGHDCQAVTRHLRIFGVLAELAIHTPPAAPSRGHDQHAQRKQKQAAAARPRGALDIGTHPSPFPAFRPG